MTVAISKSGRGRRAGGDLRVDRETPPPRPRRTPRARGSRRSSCSPQAPSRPGSSRRRVRSARACSRFAAASTRRSRRRGPSSDRGTHVLVNSLNPDRLDGPEDGRVRDRRGARRRARRPRAPVRRRGQPDGLRARLRRVRGTASARRRRGGRASDDRRLCDPDRHPGPRRDGRRGPRSVRRRRRLAHRRGDPPSLARARARRGRVLRAVVRSRPRGARARRARARLDGRLRRHGHGLKDPESASRLSPEPVAVDPDPDAIEAASR